MPRGRNRDHSNFKEQCSRSTKNFFHSHTGDRGFYSRQLPVVLRFHRRLQRRALDQRLFLVKKPRGGKSKIKTRYGAIVRGRVCLVAGDDAGSTGLKSPTRRHPSQHQNSATRITCSRTNARGAGEPASCRNRPPHRRKPTIGCCCS